MRHSRSLLTGSQLTAIFGSTFPNARANGGRLEYDNGIDTSIGQSQGNYDLDYTVYVGDSAADMAAIWGQQGAAGFPDVAGSWKTAFWSTAIDTLYVYATDTRALLVKVTPIPVSGVPTAAEESTWQQLCEKVATQLVTAFGSH